MIKNDTGVIAGVHMDVNIHVYTEEAQNKVISCFSDPNI